MKFTSALLAAALALVVPAVAFAQAQPRAATAPATDAPSRMVLANSQRVLATLEKRRSEFSRDRNALYAFIKSEFDQMFDRDYAARLVLGTHARGADPAEIRAFSDALGDNLMRRYGSSLLDFNTRLTPRIRSQTALPGKFGVRVNSELVRGGGDPIPVAYWMHQVNGQWKVYDVQIEGVSMISTFRSQFAAPLAQKGIRQLTRELASGQVQADARR